MNDKPETNTSELQPEQILAWRVEFMDSMRDHNSMVLEGSDCPYCKTKASIYLAESFRGGGGFRRPDYDAYRCSNCCVEIVR